MSLSPKPLLLPLSPSTPSSSDHISAASAPPPPPPPPSNGLNCLRPIFPSSPPHPASFPPAPPAVSSSSVSSSSSSSDSRNLSLANAAAPPPPLRASRSSHETSSAAVSLHRVRHSSSADHAFAAPDVEAVESGPRRATASLSGDLSRDLGRSGSVGSGRRDIDRRVVYINNADKTNERYECAGNKVKTSKYTAISFLPQNLFEQFHRAAYIYFLILICLNQIPQLAVFGRFVSIVPLALVLFVTAIKDGYEDWRRHRSDDKENRRLAMVLQHDHYESKQWKHIRVGDVVRIQANETIPCDMVLLKTSDPGGLAYVQTINLDGESNLKTRYSRHETAAAAEGVGVGVGVGVSGRVICEKPNRNIYGFTAFLELDGKQLPLGPSNIILRGCELKNTAWAIGVAVYAGQETKVMLNSAGAQSKSSRLEAYMNGGTLWLAAFLFGICTVCAVGMGAWLKRHRHELNVLPYYTTDRDSPLGYYGVGGEAVIAFLSSVISFQIMIPISLYISMELVRLCQSFFMIHDVNMYHEETDSRMQCRDLSINEDLGQVKFIFSDKTGTLTENKMEFCSASIFGESYDADTARGPESGSRLLNNLRTGSVQGREREAIHDFLLTLAACNTVVPTRTSITVSGTLEMEAALSGGPVEDDRMGRLEYQGESPDEQALVTAAASYGYRLLSRTTNYIIVNVLGQIHKFEVLGMHEFDSNRKCMSVVLRFPDGTVKVLVKGADSTLFRKIALSKGMTQIGDEEQSHIIFNTQLHIAEFSGKGLRTLVVAARELSKADLEDWQRMYTKANGSVSDRVQLLNEASELVEKDLTLLGATGIEDRLQNGVPDAISTLRKAGIKIWVLTGDKQETAISIGFSSALLTNEMKQIIINEGDKERCREALHNAKMIYVMSSAENRQQAYGNGNDSRRRSFDAASFGSVEMQSSVRWSQVPVARFPDSEQGNSQRTRTLALIIDGNSLVHALEPDLEQELYDLAIACDVVICCRVAPLQKAGIVSLVKRRSGELTLAIGDGANDVSMIQMADVGVGISGQEGRQAVLASDFALGQFKFLKHLLLVHGRLNYRRLGYMVLYNFYRNAVLVMLLFWYLLYTAFSTSPAITQWSLVLYSIIYTSVPTIVVATFDRDLHPTTLLKYATLYKGGQNDESYNRQLFWLTMLDTVWQSLVIFFVPFLTYWGSDIDIWSIGSLWIAAVVVVVNIHLAMDVEHFNWIIHLAIWGSIVATYVCLIVLDMIEDETQEHYWVIFHVTARADYWVTMFVVIVLALYPRFLVKVIMQTFKPSYARIIREKEILKIDEDTTS